MGWGLGLYGFFFLLFSPLFSFIFMLPRDSTLSRDGLQGSGSQGQLWQLAAAGHRAMGESAPVPREARWVLQAGCLPGPVSGAVYWWSRACIESAASLSDKFCRISLQERRTIERGAHLPRELLRKSEEFTWLIHNIWILLISHLETKTERRTLLQRSLLSNNAFFLPKVTLDNKQ